MIKVESAGYKTYYDNITLGANTTVNLSVHLKKINSQSSLSTQEIYEIIGGVAGLAVIMAIIFILKRR